MAYKKMTFIRHFNEVILALIWPFASFISSILHYKDKFSNVFVVLFFGLIGLTRKIIVSDDAAFWTEKMFSYQGAGYDSFLLETFDSNGTEVLNVLYYFFLYISSVIFSTPSWFWAFNFMAFAAILVFIYRILLYDSSNSAGWKLNSLYFLIFLLFFPFSSYGVRFWIATLFFVLGFYLVHIKKKKRGYFFLILSVTFHFAFFYLLAIYFLSRFLVQIDLKKFLIYTTIGAILFFLVVNVVMNGPFAALDSKLSYYSDTSDRSEYMLAKSFYVLFDRIICPIACVLVVFYLYKTVSKQSKTIGFILKFLIIYAFSLCFLFSFYDALDRFSRVYSFMTLCSIIYIINSGVKYNKLVVYSVSFVYLYHVMVNFVLTRSWLDFSVMWSSLFALLSKQSNSIYIY